MKGKKRTDVCATCKAWDSHCQSKTEAIISEKMCFIEGLYPEYFKDLPNDCHFIDGDDFVRAQSHKYIRTLKDRIPPYKQMKFGVVGEILKGWKFASSEVTPGDFFEAGNWEFVHDKYIMCFEVWIC